MLSSKLHMNADEAEKWLVDIIRSAQLEAKIDATERQVIMAVTTQSVYSQIADKMRDAISATRQLVNELDSRMSDSSAPTSSYAPHRSGGAAAGSGGYAKRG
ncbi:hypothetical protein EON66_00660 [archaeon]|nr:MAG: hypothetical protein EON66_00660 [archaeon]